MKISKLKPGYYKLLSWSGVDKLDCLILIRPDRSGKVVWGWQGICIECKNIDALNGGRKAIRLPELYGVVHIKHAKVQQWPREE
jgi:hypothetical protein